MIYFSFSHEVHPTQLLDGFFPSWIRSIRVRPHFPCMQQLTIKRAAVSRYYIFTLEASSSAASRSTSVINFIASQMAVAAEAICHHTLRKVCKISIGEDWSKLSYPAVNEKGRL